MIRIRFEMFWLGSNFRFTTIHNTEDVQGPSLRFGLLIGYSAYRSTWDCLNARKSWLSKTSLFAEMIIASVNEMNDN